GRRVLRRDGLPGRREQAAHRGRGRRLGRAPDQDPDQGAGARERDLPPELRPLVPTGAGGAADGRELPAHRHLTARLRLEDERGTGKDDPALSKVIPHPSSFVSRPSFFVKTITRFPHQFTETEDCWIPLPDGARLAAKLWLPDIAEKAR